METANKALLFRYVKGFRALNYIRSRSMHCEVTKYRFKNTTTTYRLVRL